MDLHLHCPYAPAVLCATAYPTGRRRSQRRIVYAFLWGMKIVFDLPTRAVTRGRNDIPDFYSRQLQEGDYGRGKKTWHYGSQRYLAAFYCSLLRSPYISLDTPHHVLLCFTEDGNDKSVSQLEGTACLAPCVGLLPIWYLACYQWDTKRKTFTFGLLLNALLYSKVAAHPTDGLYILQYTI